MPRVEESVTFQGARIIKRNFRGLEGPFNKEGDRNFCVLIEDEALADQLYQLGWAIKHLRPRGEEEVGTPFLQVKVSFENRPPHIYLVTKRRGQMVKTELGEDFMDLLDAADINYVDLRIRPYNWSVRGETGVKAYCDVMYCILHDDELQQKWEEVPELTQGGDILAIESNARQSYDFDAEVIEGDIPIRGGRIDE